VRIALTHNLRVTGGEEEAEFDRPETIEAIAAGLRALGHEVEPVEVAGPTARTVAKLEAHAPELVFNVAEGRRGPYREAFFPALFDELGLPYTASDAHVCSVALDKAVTKHVVGALGVRTPRWRLVKRGDVLDATGLELPVIVKPNFEGSSKGIVPESVVDDPAALPARVAAMLERFPAGILVEEFVAGRDVSVALLARGGALTVLPPVELVHGDGNPRAVLDLATKLAGVETRVPARIDPWMDKRLRDLAGTVGRALGFRDFAVLDFRIDGAGNAHFLEANALPALDPAGVLATAARAAELSFEHLLRSILDGAAARHELSKRGATKTKKRPTRVGLSFNVKRTKPGMGGVDDDEAEYDSPATIGAIRDALASYGHEVVDLEATPELASVLPSMGIDVVFNLAEGFRGRNREAQIPALLELLGIEYTGSDPATLALALDKALAKRIVQHSGVPTPKWVTLVTGKEKLPKDLEFPVMVKPVAEGSSKGVLGSSAAENEAQLREIARGLIERYRQPALVEEFLTGREFTVGLLGEGRPRVLPPMEIVFLRKDVALPIYGFDQKLDQEGEVRYEAPAKLEPELAKEIERVARASFESLGCRDVARIDVRLDRRGRVNFIECNPLPGLTPDWSDLCLIANACGMDYRALIGEILAPALRRFRARQRKGG
jgi:D-alanine-D-alanine ligase